MFQATPLPMQEDVRAKGRLPATAELSPDGAWILLKWLAEDNRWHDIDEAVHRYERGDLDGAGGQLDRLRRSGALSQLANIIVEDLLLGSDCSERPVDRFLTTGKEENESSVTDAWASAVGDQSRQLIRKPHLKLSMKQRVVLGYVRDGLTNKQIAVRLGVSLNTVKWHLKIMSRILRAPNRTTLIKIAEKKNLFGVS
jgi:DNA-binding CsgD family transcriptional regulator